MLGGSVRSREHLRYGRTVRSAKAGAQARAAMDRVVDVEVLRPTLRVQAPPATTKARAETTTAQRKAASKARRPDRDPNEEPSPDKKTGAKEAFTQPAKRGAVLQVKMKGKYGAGKQYSFADVCRLGQMIESNTIKLSHLKTDHPRHDPLVMNVPYGTMKEWGMDDHDWNMKKLGKKGHQGKPHWKVDKEMRRRKELKPAGGYKGTGHAAIGAAAEKRLMLGVSKSAQAGTPYAPDEIDDLLRDTAVKMKIRAPSTGKLYAPGTNVRNMKRRFMQRADAAGIPLFESNGGALSRARASGASLENVVRFEKLLDDALVKWQTEGGMKLTLADVGNFDEFCIDLVDFAGGKFIFINDGSPNHVVVPYEQSPHFTGLWGFVGAEALELIVISVGSDTSVPNYKHLELTKHHKPTVIIGQSASGWMTDDIKLAALKKWLSGGTELGSKPKVMNADGHQSNTSQPEVSRVMRDGQCLFAVTPAHCTAKGLQQLDLKNGLISRFKTSFRRLLSRHYRQKLQSASGRIKYSEILRIAQIAAGECTTAADQLNDNERVGYFVDSGSGLLRYKPTDAINQSFYMTSSAVGKTGAGSETARQVKTPAQAAVEAAQLKAKRDIEAVGAVIEEHNKPVIEEAEQQVDRGRRSRDTWGIPVSSEQYEGSLLDSAKKKADTKKKHDDKKGKKAREFLRTWNPLLEKAKESLEKHRPEGGEVKLTPLKVGEMKALIVGKTGKHPKAKTNKNDAMKNELRSVMKNNYVLAAMPPDPPAGGGGGDDGEEEEEEEEEDNVAQVLDMSN